MKYKEKVELNRRLADGVNEQILQLTKLILDINEAGYHEEVFEDVIKKRGTYNVCGARVEISDTTFTIEKDRVFVQMLLQEANKFETFQSILYDYELETLLKKLNILYDDDGHEIFNGVYSIYEYASTIKCMTMDEVKTLEQA